MIKKLLLIVGFFLCVAVSYAEVPSPDFSFEDIYEVTWEPVPDGIQITAHTMGEDPQLGCFGVGTIHYAFDCDPRNSECSPQQKEMDHEIGSTTYSVLISWGEIPSGGENLQFWISVSSSCLATDYAPDEGESSYIIPLGNVVKETRQDPITFGAPVPEFPIAGIAGIISLAGYLLLRRKL